MFMHSYAFFYTPVDVHLFTLAFYESCDCPYSDFLSVTQYHNLQNRLDEAIAVVVKLEKILISRV